jgi:hypothetical protein
MLAPSVFDHLHKVTKNIGPYSLLEIKLRAARHRADQNVHSPCPR